MCYFKVVQNQSIKENIETEESVLEMHLTGRCEKNTPFYTLAILKFFLVLKKYVWEMKF